MSRACQLAATTEINQYPDMQKGYYPGAPPGHPGYYPMQHPGYQEPYQIQERPPEPGYPCFNPRQDPGTMDYPAAPWPPQYMLGGQLPPPHGYPWMKGEKDTALSAVSSKYVGSLITARSALIYSTPVTIINAGAI